ncbi:hypothetical protein AX17_001677 [Amanita inopinata Kibby_2008]|nr:hypothetical protein AX17_001677 [Amanita inopinata Kibby_2008]
MYEEEEEETHLGGADNAKVIVHNFGVSKPTGLTATSNTHGDKTLNAVLLESGFTLVRDATAQNGWKNATRRIHSRHFELRPDACYIWAAKLPDISGVEHRGQPVMLRDWGEPPLEEEVIRMGEMDEFQHTTIYAAKPVQQDVPISPEKIWHPKKRRKLFSGSLYGVIAQPHFYSSSPSYSPDAQALTIKIPNYRKAAPLPIPPYTDAISPFLRPHFGCARTAWIIPVRGILPWSTCTPAVILEDNEDSLEKESSWIEWTKAALAEFWQFLLGVREAGRVGRLGFSFHTRRERGSTASSSAEVVNEQYGHSCAHGVREMQVWSLPLSSADYVKVYHEASNAMSIRSVLDAWAYITPEGPKVRVLKGSRLVLVDERSRGVLIS